MRTKILAGVLTAAMCLGLLTGCGNSGSTTPTTTGNDKATEAGGTDAATQAPETLGGGEFTEWR